MNKSHLVRPGNRGFGIRTKRILYTLLKRGTSELSHLTFANDKFEREKKPEKDMARQILYRLIKIRRKRSSWTLLREGNGSPILGSDPTITITVILGTDLVLLFSVISSTGFSTLF